MLRLVLVYVGISSGRQVMSLTAGLSTKSWQTMTLCCHC